jgi:hypothetical protein
MDIALILSEYYRGQEWTIHGNTYEALIWYDEKNSLPKPTLEELTGKWNEYVAAQPLKELRTKRNTLLEQTDRYATLDYPHSNLEVQQTWFDYRQALRDLPSLAEDPANPIWPVAPQ